MRLVIIILTASLNLAVLGSSDEKETEHAIISAAQAFYYYPPMNYFNPANLGIYYPTYDQNNDFKSTNGPAIPHYPGLPGLPMQPMYPPFAPTSYYPGMTNDDQTDLKKLEILKENAALNHNGDILMPSIGSPYPQRIFSPSFTSYFSSLSITTVTWTNTISLLTWG